MKPDNSKEFFSFLNTKKQVKMGECPPGTYSDFETNICKRCVNGC